MASNEQEALNRAERDLRTAQSRYDSIARRQSSPENRRELSSADNALRTAKAVRDRAQSQLGR
jgi:hypothetical protein